MATFRIREKRTRSDACTMIKMMALYGRGRTTKQYSLDTEDGLKLLLADHGYPDYKKALEEFRHKDAVIHTFAGNLSPPSWGVNLPPGKSFFAVRQAGGAEIARIEGESGIIVMSEYEERFEDAVRNLRRCVGEERAHYGDLLSCFADGMASLEAYVNHRTDPYKQYFVADAKQIVSLDEKLFTWIPQLTGRQIDKGKRNWQDFAEIRRVRNDYHSHPKSHVHALSDSLFCKRLNLFRTGIARLLIDLHVLLGTGPPVDVFTYAYLPDIELVAD